jgi:hypothetical protein
LKKRGHGNCFRAMRTIFVVYLMLIITGLAFYTVIGLTHH